MKKLLLALALMVGSTNAIEFDILEQGSGHVMFQVDENSGWETRGKLGYFKNIYKRGNYVIVATTIPMTKSEYDSLQKKLGKFGYYEYKEKSYSVSVMTVTADKRMKNSLTGMKELHPNYDFPIPTYQIEVELEAEDFLNLTIEKQNLENQKALNEQLNIF